jgi:hypothetical protein
MNKKRNRRSVSLDRIWKNQLHGGALFLALVLVMMVSILVSALFVLDRHASLYVNNYQNFLQHRANLKSAATIADSDYFGESTERSLKIFDQFDLFIRRRIWGAFLNLKCASKDQHLTLEENGLFGTYLPADTVLIVRENGKQIGLNGKVTLGGICLLPKRGIVKGVTGSFDRDAFKASLKNVTASPEEFNLLNANYIAQVIRQFDQDPNLDSSVAAKANLYNSFKNKTLVIVPSMNELKSVHWRGNIKVLADEIIVDSSSRLDNVLLVARKIVIGPNVKAKFHVLASDSIIINENAELFYPSSLTLCARHRNSTEPACLLFKGPSSVNGSIVLFEEDPKSTNQNVIAVLNTGTKLNGLLYSAGYSQLSGEIKGLVVTSNVILKNSTGYIPDQINDCVITPAESPLVVSPFVERNQSITKSMTLR